MEVSSVQQLCQFLISCSIQRCRISGSLCRLSVFLKSSPVSDHPLVGISVSDTGAGSCLQEFQCLRYIPDSASSEAWDGVVSLTTTSISNNEIYHYHLNLKEEVFGRNMRKLPSRPKNGAKFSGTEVSFSVFGSVDQLLPSVTKFLEKILILKIPNIAIDLVVEDGENSESICKNLVPPSDLMDLSSATSNMERLQLGLQNYVLKHGKDSNEICHSCFTSREDQGVVVATLLDFSEAISLQVRTSVPHLLPGNEHLKVGSGVAYKMENNRSNAQVMEAVVIINERPQSAASSCSRACEDKTEVLYFKDFSPFPISESSLNGLTSIDWKTYGLTLRSVADHDSRVLLEWEKLPPNVHIGIALHHYYKQVVMPSTIQNTHSDQNLIRKAVKLALNDLKEKYSGALLSPHAVKICNYAPDLAKTLAGLILSSNDANFQVECLSLLQLPSKGTVEKTVEDCIERKLTAAIEMNDRKPKRNREPAPMLFEDEHSEEPDVFDEEYEGEEVYVDVYSSLDI